MLAAIFCSFLFVYIATVCGPSSLLNHAYMLLGLLFWAYVSRLCYTRQMYLSMHYSHVSLTVRPVP